MMEVTQMQKFALRQNKLDFSNGWIANEEDCVYIDLDPALVDEILTTPSRILELADLLDARDINEPFSLSFFDD
jgi:hypothetical protein